jgi:DNA modification methylase
LPDCTVDSIVTDPPYELGFMGKKWDNSGIAYNPELWAECLRVLKPGGHLLAFGGTRTYHRMAVAIEDAGFEIRDSLHWIYGSGFPKSLDVSKAIDKQRDDSEQSAVVASYLLQFNTFKSVSDFRSYLNQHIVGEKHSGGSAQGWTTVDTANKVKPRVPTWEQWLALKSLLDFGDEMDAEVWRLNGRKGQPGENWAKREVIGSKMTGIANKDEGPRHTIGASKAIEVDITAPATDAAKEWSGWGTALKPAHEPIVVARKPLESTVAGNVLQYGTGAINIDGARVGTDEVITNHARSAEAAVSKGKYGDSSAQETHQTEGQALGRWPANIVFTHNHDCADICTEGCPVRELDRQSGTSRSLRSERGAGKGQTGIYGVWGVSEDTTRGHADSGGASRFFTVTEWEAPFRYVAKPGKRERNAGLDHLPEVASAAMQGNMVDGQRIGGDGSPIKTPMRQNHHPTVKPLALMRWLVRLVTPPGGTVLEPFAGSGTTLVACHMEGFDAIGIEMTDEYLPIIEGRLEWARQQPPEQQSDQQELEL